MRPPADAETPETGQSDADADADSSIDADADAALPWCETQPAHDLCDEFDRAPLGTRWDATDTMGGGELRLDPTTSLSSPSSLVSELPALAASAGRQAATLKRTLLGPTGGFRCELSVRAPSAHADRDVRFFEAVFTSPATVAGYSFELIQAGANVRATERATGTDGAVERTDTGLPALGAQWRRFTVTLTRGAAPSLVVTVDGTPVVTRAATPPSGEMPSVTFFFGASLDGGTPGRAWTLNYENVSCDLLK